MLGEADQTLVGVRGQVTGHEVVVLTVAVDEVLLDIDVVGAGIPFDRDARWRHALNGQVLRHGRWVDIDAADTHGQRGRLVGAVVVEVDRTNLVAVASEVLEAGIGVRGLAAANEADVGTVAVDQVLLDTKVVGAGFPFEVDFGGADVQNREVLGHARRLSIGATDDGFDRRTRLGAGALEVLGAHEVLVGATLDDFGVDVEGLGREADVDAVTEDGVAAGAGDVVPLQADTRSERSGDFDVLRNNEVGVAEAGEATGEHSAAWLVEAAVDDVAAEPETADVVACDRPAAIDVAADVELDLVHEGAVEVVGHRHRVRGALARHRAVVRGRGLVVAVAAGVDEVADLLDELVVATHAGTGPAVGVATVTSVVPGDQIVGLGVVDLQHVLAARGPEVAGGIFDVVHLGPWRRVADVRRVIDRCAGLGVDGGRGATHLTVHRLEAAADEDLTVVLVDADAPDRAAGDDGVPGWVDRAVVGADSGQLVDAGTGVARTVHVAEVATDVEEVADDLELTNDGATFGVPRTLNPCFEGRVEVAVSVECGERFGAGLAVDVGELAADDEATAWVDFHRVDVAVELGAEGRVPLAGTDGEASEVTLVVGGPVVLDDLLELAADVHPVAELLHVPDGDVERGRGVAVVAIPDNAVAALDRTHVERAGVNGGVLGDFAGGRTVGDDPLEVGDVVAVGTGDAEFDRPAADGRCGTDDFVVGEAPAVGETDDVDRSAVGDRQANAVADLVPLIARVDDERVADLRSEDLDLGERQDAGADALHADVATGCVEVDRGRSADRAGVVVAGDRGVADDVGERAAGQVGGRNEDVEVAEAVRAAVGAVVEIDGADVAGRAEVDLPPRVGFGVGVRDRAGAPVAGAVAVDSVGREAATAAVVG